MKINLKLVKQDFKTMSKKDLHTLYKYYNIPFGNINELISKIYSPYTYKTHLPSGLMEAIEKQDFEAFKQICDNVANEKPDGIGFNDPPEGYDIFKTIQYSTLPPVEKAKWETYLVEDKHNYPHTNHKLILNGDKIELDPEINVNILGSIRPT